MRRKAKDLPGLVPEQKVWIRTTQTTGTVQGPSSTPRSYVETDQGSLRINTAQLTVLLETVPPNSDGTVTGTVQPDSDETVTRSGRVSRPTETGLVQERGRIMPSADSEVPRQSTLAFN